MGSLVAHNVLLTDFCARGIDWFPSHLPYEFTRYRTHPLWKSVHYNTYVHVTHKVAISESGGSNAARKPIAWGTVRKLEVRRAPWWPRLGDQTCWPSKNAISLNHRGRATFGVGFCPQNQRKIEFGLIRWAGPSLRVFTAIFLAYLHVLEVIQAVFPRIYVKWRNNARFLHGFDALT